MIAISLVLVAIIGLVVTLSLTTFSLKEISVDFRTSTSKLTATHDEIIESGDFSKRCVLFYNKNKSVEKIERAFPYIKVINIETIYPSSFVIHVAERQEVYMIHGENKTYFLDENLKVLDIRDGQAEVSEFNPILLKGIDAGSAEIGDFLSGNYKDIYSAFLQSNVTLGMQKEMFKEVEFRREREANAKQDYLNAYFTLFSGHKIKIIDVSYGLKYKASLAHQVYSSLYTFIGKEYKISAENRVTLSKEMLDGVTIVVQSYYDFTHYKESEVCFAFNFA